jgi:hypothetical protein
VRVERETLRHTSVQCALKRFHERRRIRKVGTRRASEDEDLPAKQTHVRHELVSACSSAVANKLTQRHTHPSLNLLYVPCKLVFIFGLNYFFYCEIKPTLQMPGNSSHLFSFDVHFPYESGILLRDERKSRQRLSSS